MVSGGFSRKYKEPDPFFAYVTLRLPMSGHKKFSLFGPAIWPAIGNIYIYIYECLVLLYRFKGTVNVISSYSPFIV